MVLAAGAPQAVFAISFAARASIAPQTQYVGDAAGTTFALTVKNTGTVQSIGAVRVTRPNAFWSVASCPVAPSGWSKTAAADSCTYLSTAGTADNIQKKHSAAFSFVATTAPSVANRTGIWAVTVSSLDDFSDPSWVKQAAGVSPWLRTRALSFEVTDAVLATSAATVGAACPAANQEGQAGTTAVVVICGTNHTSVAQLPKPAYSTLAGTLLAAPGTFSSSSVPAGATNVVLGNWSGATLAASGTGYSVVTRIGAFAGRTSPVKTLTGYELTNTAPVANDDSGASFSTLEDNPLSAPSVLTNDTDADGDPLTAALDSGPSNASSFALNADGTFSYTPNADFNGNDSFTYHANDGSLDSNTATVTIGVSAANDAPVANDDSGATYTTDEDTPLSVVAPGFLGNDTDVDGGALSLFNVNGTSAWVSSPPVSTTQSGALTPSSTGAFSYTPPANFHGTDTFTYTAYDGSAESNTATVTITVNSVNDAPVAVDGAFSMPENTYVQISATNGALTDATDADADSLTAVPVSGPSHADTNGFILYADGGIFYQPAPNYIGTDSFTWKAYDGTAYSNVATVTITVNSSGGGGGGGGGGCGRPSVFGPQVVAC
jgi:VCBS repeat-containing protein